MMLLQLAILASICGTVASVSLRDAVEGRDDLTRFRMALQELGMYEQVLGDESKTMTIFAPNDSSIDDSPLWNMYFTGIKEQPPTWNKHLQAAVNNCIVEGPGLKKAQVFNNINTSLESMQDSLLISQFLQRVGGAPIETPDIEASNGVLHVMGGILQAKFFDNSFANLELQPEFGPDWLNRTSLATVVDFVGGRNLLAQPRANGTTMIGCRVRGFNRMGLDYLTQTINDSPTVQFGELLNETRRNETRDELNYSLLPKNYYSEDLPAGFYDLVLPVNGCAHMWVNKFEDTLVFNDARTIKSPEERTYLASNGPGYVTDKCQVCPGISMLTQYAGDWSPFDTKATAKFFIASEWNMRDLRQNVGGANLTLFAPVKQAWSVLNQDDIVRLASDQWKPHQLDLLGNMLVEGIWLEQDLKDKYIENGGPYTLTSTINQLIPIDYDETRDKVIVSGGDLFFADIKGVDGRAHFVTKATLPWSMIDTVYDIAKKREDLSFHATLIDTVRLNEDMEFLSPLTAIYVPNSAWAGTKIQLLDIAPVILESHIFEDLLWCEDLRALAGQRIESLNGETWFIEVNDDGFPCFLTEQVFGGPSKRSCLTECDILARNGIVHVLDTLLIYETNEADDIRPPSGSSPAGAPVRAPTFTRPTPSSPSPPSMPSFSSPSFSPPTGPSGSSFGQFDGQGSSTNGNSGAAEKMGGLVLAGILSLFAMLCI